VPTYRTSSNEDINVTHGFLDATHGESSIPQGKCQQVKYQRKRDNSITSSEKCWKLFLKGRSSSCPVVTDLNHGSRISASREREEPLRIL
jgi:hypothetical protein